MNLNQKAEDDQEDQKESRAVNGLQKATAFMTELTALDPSMQISTALSPNDTTTKTKATLRNRIN